MSSSPRIAFMVGGVQKAGTTALCEALRLHPQLRLPTAKEAHVFDAPDYDDAAAQEQIDQRFEPLFAQPFRDGILHGDATPVTLFHPLALARVRRYNPAMRWVIVLRDPAARARSQHAMERARGDERWPFWAAVLAEPLRLWRAGADWSEHSAWRHHSYLARGRYLPQLRRLYAMFPAAQILLLAHTEWRDHPAVTLQRVYRHLQIEGPVRQPHKSAVPADRYSGSRAVMALLQPWSAWQRLRVRGRFGIDPR